MIGERKTVFRLFRKPVGDGGDVGRQTVPEAASSRRKRTIANDIQSLNVTSDHTAHCVKV